MFCLTFRSDLLALLVFFIKFYDSKNHNKTACERKTIIGDLLATVIGRKLLNYQYRM